MKRENRKPLSESLDFLETFAGALVKGVRVNVEKTIRESSARPLNARDRRRVRAVAGGLRLASDLVSDLLEDDAPQVARGRRK
jgi:hypothetical protein